MREVPLYGGKHVGTWSSAQKKARVESEKEKRLRALRGARPNIVGYIGGCDQEQGKIEFTQGPSWGYLKVNF